MRRTAVINVVGLTESLIGDASPNIRKLVQRGLLTYLTPALPAVTCSVQASMLTGQSPSQHGIVANGWYDRDLAEIQFWKQSNRLVQGEKVWETARKRDAAFTCANMFWWFNMYSSVDVSVTPRPIYKADGRKIPDCYSEPPELRDQLQQTLGTFPLFHFWGPASNILSTRWIVDASLIVHRQYQPSLMLIYLPHLDYALQKFGPDHPAIATAIRKVDTEIGRLLEAFDRDGVQPIIVSEYGIEPVHTAVPINRILRNHQLTRVRVEQGLELLDPGASRAFAVADHQIAHVYINDPADVQPVAALCSQLQGVEQVLNRDDQAAAGINHPRSGELLLIAAEGHWFSYDYWLNDANAPDFARTVDIHRKPGYDPRELFIDPAIRFPKLAIAWRLMKKKLGQRTLMDVIPLDATLVRGSHGRVSQPPAQQPIMILPAPVDLPSTLPCQAVRDVILNSLFGTQLGA